MPFNLGFLGGGGAQGPAPSHGAGPGALGDLGRLKVSQGYLEEQKSQNAYNREQDFNAKVEKEQGRRREAIDAWLGAVRSGNRADVFVLGKRLNAMGINVQMPTAFSATGVPGENDLAAPTTPSFVDSQGRPVATDPAAHPNAQEHGQSDAEYSADTARMVKEFRDTHGPGGYPKQSATGAAVDKLGADTVGALGGTYEPPGAGAPPGGTQFFDADAGEDVSEEEFNRRLGPPGQTTSGTPTVNPFGPNGPTTIKAPTSTWKVSDPATGINIEISPEEILADQYKEIDQTFGPLTQMPGLDETAQRAYQIGHEYAKGQIGFLTPKEAAAAGMAAADRYMTHMYQQGMVDAAMLKAMKAARGGGTGGGGAFSQPGKARSGLANQVVDNARQTISSVKTSNNYLGRQKAIDAGEEVMQSFEQGNGVGDRNALGQYIKSISGAATTDKERAFYMGAAGIVPKLQNIYNYWAKGGQLSPELKAELRRLKEQVTAHQRKKQEELLERAAEAAADEADFQYDEAGVADPNTKGRARKVIRGMTGAQQEKQKSRKGGGNKTTQKYRNQGAGG